MSDVRDLEAKDWARLAEMCESMSEYAMVHLDKDTGQPVAGSIYEDVYPLLHKLARTADVLVGWNMRRTVAWREVVGDV